MILAIPANFYELSLYWLLSPLLSNSDSTDNLLWIFSFITHKRDDLSNISSRLLWFLRWNQTTHELVWCWTYGWEYNGFFLCSSTNAISHKIILYSLYALSPVFLCLVKFRHSPKRCHLSYGVHNLVTSVIFSDYKEFSSFLTQNRTC